MINTNTAYPPVYRFKLSEKNMIQILKVMLCRVFGFRVKVWESYRT